MSRTSSILTLGLIALSLSACQRRSDNTVVQKDRISVEVMSVQSDARPGGAKYSGSIKPLKENVVSSPHSGKLVSVEVSIGDRVSKGQVIARVESQNVRSTYEMAHATLSQAEDGYARAQQVYSSGSLAEVKMVEITTQLQKARAAAASADKALEDCSVKAPYDGVISEVLAEESTDIEAFSPIARIMDLSSLQVSIKVPEAEIGQMGVGQEALVDIAAVSANGVKARLKSKGVSASSLTHNYECIFTLSGVPSDVMPGMVCTLSIRKDDRSGISIPASAVLTAEDGRQVYVVDRDSRVDIRKVKTGEYVSDCVMIEEGLQEGDLVIVKGSQKVSKGMEVKTVEWKGKNQ